MANDGKIFEEVQAALLNSECSPEYAVRRAMLALLSFAYTEAEMGLLDVVGVVESTWDQNDLGDPNVGRDPKGEGEG